MKHLIKFNENRNGRRVEECIVGHTHHVSDTSATFYIDGEEYQFTVRESGDYGVDYKIEFLPDLDLPFELTEELKDEMFSLYSDESSRNRISFR